MSGETMILQALVGLGLAVIFFLIHKKLNLRGGSSGRILLAITTFIVNIIGILWFLVLIVIHFWKGPKIKNKSDNKD
jgi:hypothetical protein